MQKEHPVGNFQGHRNNRFDKLLSVSLCDLEATINDILRKVQMQKEILL